ncbi:hypothetical protein Bca52824_042884 [Brassica carinata]|uniref:Uncharacterized protein n=1 Tax=Brassica carinata TaxID=52824 RepID=A0A8X7S026_BRACI|nr:hypothetical protein Bca52824_042884 [Brassica carinata]
MNKPHPRKGKNNRGLGRRVNRAEQQREPQIELTGKIPVKNRRQHQERCDRETVANRPSPKGKTTEGQVRRQNKKLVGCTDAGEEARTKRSSD